MGAGPFGHRRGGWRPLVQGSRYASRGLQQSTSLTGLSFRLVKDCEVSQGVSGSVVGVVQSVHGRTEKR